VIQNFKLLINYLFNEKHPAFTDAPYFHELDGSTRQMEQKEALYHNELQRGESVRYCGLQPFR